MLMLATTSNLNNKQAVQDKQNTPANNIITSYFDDGLTEAITLCYKPKILFVFLFSSSLTLSPFPPLSLSAPSSPSITPSREVFPTWGYHKEHTHCPLRTHQNTAIQSPGDY